MNNIYDKRYALVIKLLRQYRLNSKMTQQELATQLNRSQAYVSKYELGDSRLDIVETLNICNILGIKFSQFANDLENIIKENNLDD